MQAIILAGGLGSRLRSAVPDLPKVMAPVRSRPFLAILIDYLGAEGVDSVLLSVGYRHELIVEYFGDGYGSVSISYVIEREPLGTGGAIRKALAMASADPVLVLNGDTFLRVDYRKMMRAHLASGATSTIGLKQVDDVSRYGSVAVADGRVVRFLEKQAAGPGLINTGVYILGKGIFDGFELPESFSFERDFLYRSLDAISPHGHIVDGYFIDIGIPEDYARAISELAG